MDVHQTTGTVCLAAHYWHSLPSSVHSALSDPASQSGLALPRCPATLVFSFSHTELMTPSSMIHCGISWNPGWSRAWHSLQVPALPWPLPWHAVLGGLCSFRSWWMLSYCCVRSPDRWHTGKTTPLEQRLLLVRYPCILSVWGLAQSSHAYKVTSAGLRLFLQSLLFCVSSSRLEIW